MKNDKKWLFVVNKDTGASSRKKILLKKKENLWNKKNINSIVKIKFDIWTQQEKLQKSNRTNAKNWWK